jgi:hypothetical protein
LFAMIDMGATAKPREFGPNSLILGYDFGWVNDADPPTFSGPPYALWLPRHSNGGGSDVAPERQEGISEAGDFMREHLAPLRGAVPVALDTRSEDATNVRLYRVGVSFLHTGIRVSG